MKRRASLSLSLSLRFIGWIDEPLLDKRASRALGNSFLAPGLASGYRYIDEG